MYYPYLRGRQSELLAIRRLLENELLDEKIIPIIEPIKLTPTLIKTLELFIEKEKELIIIENPQVGDFKREYKNSNHDYLVELLKNETILNACILNSETSPSTQKDLFGYILDSEDSLKLLPVFDFEKRPKCIIPDKTAFRRALKGKTSLILLGDHFIQQKRNADYLELASYTFSSDHLHYEDEGYIGFSDFSIVGSSFMEGGFAPRAVAIHMVSFGQNWELKINHFTSEDNDDISNPAGKYHQALEKLVDFFDESSLDPFNHTYALEQFRKHHKLGTYPGLGTVKQLSIMHHLELISYFFNRGDSHEDLC